MIEIDITLSDTAPEGLQSPNGVARARIEAVVFSREHAHDILNSVLDNIYGKVQE